MKVDRRRALGGLGAGLVAPACAATGEAVTQPVGPNPFAHGVAAGDPALRSVILWTRISPGDAAGRAWAVVVEESSTGRVAFRRSGRTGADRDHTVKVEATGLLPGQDYQYRFTSDGHSSTIGRFRTLPERAEEVVLAVVSCSLHPGGLFNAYDAVAKLPRVDAVVHLGDYIYEYGARPNDYGVGVGQTLNRLPDPPHEIVTLADYRRRHAQYKSDPDLQAAHARAAWITVWDDHETANDSWLGGAENHDADPNEGDWAARKAAALKAYYEWMPIREPAPGRSLEMADRTFRFADIATLHMVETRLLARSKQLDYATDLTFNGGVPDLEGFRAKLNAPDRNLLGATQLGTLTRAVQESVRSGVTWQVLGNQIVMARVRGPDLARQMTPEQLAPVLAGLPDEYRPRVQQALRLFALDVPYNLDAWDGYPAERERLYAALKAAGAHAIALAGDSHAFWVNDLKDASGAQVGAEFGATSVTSPGFSDIVKGVDLGAAYAAQNEEVVFSDQGAKGFTLLTLTKAEARAELMAVSTILAKPYDTRSLGAYRVRPAAGAGTTAVEKI